MTYESWNEVPRSDAENESLRFEELLALWVESIEVLANGGEPGDSLHPAFGADLADCLTLTCMEELLLTP
jgi:hypothetical protein